MMEVFLASTSDEVVQCLRRRNPFKIATNLKELQLMIMGFRSGEMKLLVEGLKNNSTLEHLRLGMNELGDEGVKIVCDWLMTNSSLKSLGLGMNGIGKKGVEHVVQVLKSNSSLEQLLLGGNRLGDETALVLTEGLKSNSSLKELNLGESYIGEKGAGYLLEGVKSNTSLLILDLSGNPCFGKIAQQTIEKLLGLRRGLHDASFAGNTQDMSGILNLEEGKLQLLKEREEGTPLHYAVLGDHLQAVRLLLVFGANPTLPNKHGKRPIELAKSEVIRQELLQESLETVKMVVLGHGRVGKTTTIKGIKNLEVLSRMQDQQRLKKVAHENSTIGLDVSALIVPQSGAGGKDTKVRIWDFAGQLEYLPCHRQFLSSKRTIYIVMVDGSKSVLRQREDLKYWLEFIARSVRPRDREGRFASERLLLVVGTKIDLREKEDIVLPSQLEQQYLEVVGRVDPSGVIFNKDWTRAASISNTNEETISQLQRQLFEMARIVKTNAIVDGMTLRKASALFSLIQDKSKTEGTVVCRHSEISTDLEALEYLHNSGEIAFLKEIGWICMNGPVLERCVGLFIGPEPHQRVLSSFTSSEPVIDKEEVIRKVQNYLSTTHSRVVQTGGVLSVIEVMKAIGICFESRERECEIKLVFPSELGNCDNLVLPLSQQNTVWHQIAITRRGREEIGREEFQKVLSVLWRIRCEGLRIFLNGILVIPSPISSRQNGNETDKVTLVELRWGRVLVTSKNRDAVEEIEGVVLRALKMVQGLEGEFLVRKVEDQERSPIWNEVIEYQTALPTSSVLSSEGLAELLSSSSSQPHTIPSISPVKLELKDFFGVVLSNKDTNPSLQREFESVKRQLFEFLTRGHMNFDFELDKVVVIYNSQVESKFMRKMHDFLWKPKQSLSSERRFEEPGTNEWKMRQRVLKRLEDYVLQVPGSERTNLLLAWNAHERKNLYLNAVNGHWIPPPVEEALVEKMKRGIPVDADLGYFGRGAYFSQTPQYVLEYVRGTGEDFVLQLNWILPGKVYPVIEPIIGPGTLHGQPCVSGFDSHYVLTNNASPVGLGEEVVGDELAIFSTEQIYPRYLVFLRRATSFGEIKGTGFGVLKPGPVLIWVDDKTPDVLPEIRLLQETAPEEGRIDVYHFKSTGEALTWIGKHQEPLIYKAELGHLRIGTNSYRPGEVEVLAGKRLYSLIRQTKQFSQVPILVFCGDDNTAGFTPEEVEKDRFLRITTEYEEAVELGGTALRWLKGKFFEWRTVIGPELHLRVIQLLGLSEKKKRERFFATLSLLEDNPKKPGRFLWKSETEVGGCWEAMVPNLSLTQGLRLTVFQRSVLKDVIGFVNITAKNIERMRSGESEEVEWTLDNGKEEGTLKRKRKRVKVRVMKLESKLGWF